MCLSHSINQVHPTPPARSANMDKVDRLVQALRTDDQEDDTMMSLSSSLQSTLMDFGIFDSLTLTKQRVLPSDSSTGKAIISRDFVQDPMVFDQEEEENEDDSIDAAWKDFDSSWEDIFKTTPTPALAPSSVRHGSPRRSGVRRGYQESTNDAPIKAIMVPTKTCDGPSFQPMLANVKQKQRASPAA